MSVKWLWSLDKIEIFNTYQISKQSCFLRRLQTIEQTVDQAVGCPKLALKIEIDILFPLIKLWEGQYWTSQLENKHTNADMHKI